jgi:hypothetical protein
MCPNAQLCMIPPPSTKYHDDEAIQESSWNALIEILVLDAYLPAPRMNGEELRDVVHLVRQAHPSIIFGRMEGKLHSRQQYHIILSSVAAV